MSTFLKSRNGVPRKQDYIVFPEQHWVDGAAIIPGVVRQFVAMPYGSGSLIEKQITGLETVGGIRIEIIPASAGMGVLVHASGKFYIYMRSDDTTDLLRQTIAGRDGVPANSYHLYFAGRRLEMGNTLGYYNIQEGSSINCDWGSSGTSTLSDFNIHEGSTIRLILRLRGGGDSRDLPSPATPDKNYQMMAIVASGKIMQAIIPDTYPDNIWRIEFRILQHSAGEFYYVPRDHQIAYASNTT